MGNVPLMRTLSTSSINWMWPQHALEVWPCRFPICCCRRCAISSNYVAIRSVHLGAFRGFDSSRQIVLSNILRELTSKQQHQGRGSSVGFTLGLKRFISRLDWFSACNIVLLRSPFIPLSAQPPTWRKLGSTGFLTDFIMRQVKPSEAAALSLTTEESCIVVLSIKVIQSNETIYPLVFFPP